MSLFISTITGRLGSLTQATRGRETRLRALYKLSRTLAEIPDPIVTLQAAWQQLHDYYKEPVLLLTPDTSVRLQVSAGDPDNFGFAGNDVQAAEWVFQNGELAGRGTDTLAGCRGTYIPLRGREKTVGVMGIRLPEDSGLIEPEQLRLMETFAVVIGGAWKARNCPRRRAKPWPSMETERLRNLVLRSFAFDLAGPAQEIAAVAKRLSGAALMRLPQRRSQARSSKHFEESRTNLQSRGATSSISGRSTADAYDFTRPGPNQSQRTLHFLQIPGDRSSGVL